MLCVFCAVAGLADENGVGQNAGQEAESQSNRKWRVIPRLLANSTSSDNFLAACHCYQ